MSLLLCPNIFDPIGFHWVSKQPQRRLMVYTQTVIFAAVLAVVGTITIAGSISSQVSIPWAVIRIDQPYDLHEGVYNGHFRLDLSTICLRSLDESVPGEECQTIQGAIAWIEQKNN